MAEHTIERSNLAGRVAPIIEREGQNVEEAIPHDHHDPAQQFVDVVMVDHRPDISGIYRPPYEAVLEEAGAFVTRVRTGDGTGAGPHRIWFAEA